MNNILIDLELLFDVYNQIRREKFPHSVKIYQQLQSHHNYQIYISSASLGELETLKRMELYQEFPRLNTTESKETLQRFLKDVLSVVKIAKTPAYIKIDYDDIKTSQLLASARSINAKIVTRHAPHLEKYPDHFIAVDALLDEIECTSTAIDFANLQKQYWQLQPAIEQQMDEVLNTTSFVMGSKVNELEKTLREFTQAQHAISCSSGTDALLLAMMALDIQPDDEIITTPFTFIATAETIALMKATPIFVDVEPISFNIDADLIEAAITDKTKAIMPVSLYGQPAEMDKINHIAQTHGLKVIIDGAQSFGASYKGQQEVHHCDIFTTSFFPAKPLGAYGDGGAVLTQNNDISTKIAMLREHGQSQRYHHQYIGMGGRLDTLQAAVLLAKLPTYAQEIELRQAVAECYTQTLDTSINTPRIPSEKTSVWAQYTLRVQNRESLQAHLQEKGIPTAIHYPMPLHLQTCFQSLALPKGSFPVAEQLSNHVISLPMNPFLSTEDILYITDTINRFMVT